MAAVVLSGSAVAQLPRPGEYLLYRSGDDIYHDCASSSSNRKLECYGYIEGIIDVMGAGDSVFGIKACIPAGLPIEAIVAAVIKEFRRSPELHGRDFTGAHAVALALDSAYHVCP